jgi:hypothetical protein
MLIMVLIVKPFSQDACKIDSCILIAGEVAEGGFGIIFFEEQKLSINLPPFLLSVIFSPKIVPLSRLLPPKLRTH